MNVNTPLEGVLALALLWAVVIGILYITNVYQTLKSNKREIKRLTQVVRELNDELANA